MGSSISVVLFLAMFAFALSTHALSSYSSFPVGNGLVGLAIDEDNNVWISYGSEEVIQLKNDGTIIQNLNGFNLPWGMKIDSYGNLWVVNNGNGTISKLSNTGIIVGNYPVGSAPSNVAFDSEQNAFVTNGYNSVTKLDNNGNVLATISFNDFKGTTGIIVDENDAVWVTNMDSYTVTKFDATTGNFIGTYVVAPLTFSGGPTDIAVDNEQNIWVANDDDNSVTKLANDGTFITTIIGLNGAFALTLDSNNNVYVANVDGKTITKINSAGVIIETYTVEMYPYNLEFDEFGNLWVLYWTETVVSKIPFSTIQAPITQTPTTQSSTTQTPTTQLPITNSPTNKFLRTQSPTLSICSTLKNKKLCKKNTSCLWGGKFCAPKDSY